MRTSVLAFAVAAPAVSMAAFAMFGPGAHHAQRAARIWGGPWDGSWTEIKLGEPLDGTNGDAKTELPASPLGNRVLSLRIQVVSRSQGIEDPVAHQLVEVRAETGNRQKSRTRIQTDRDGIADAALVFDEPLSGDVLVSVVAANAGTTAIAADAGSPEAIAADAGSPETSVLASGLLRVDPNGWAPARRACAIPGMQTGRLSVQVAGARGAWASPFPDVLVIGVALDGRPVDGAMIHLDAPGATPALADRGPTDAQGIASLPIVPLHHDIELTISARSPVGDGTWSGFLPVTPGAIWLDPEALSRTAAPQIRLVSPVPRTVAYVTIASDRLRLWGAAVPMLPTADGQAEGALPWPLDDSYRPTTHDSYRPAANADRVWVVVSSDAWGRSSGTVGWPVALNARLTPEVPPVYRALPSTDAGALCEERHFREMLLLDGVPRAEARETRRRLRAQRLAVVALGAAALLEALLLGAHARSGTKALKRLASVAREIEGDGTPAWIPTRRRWLAAIVAAFATVLLAFVAIALVVIWKTGG